MDISNNIPSAEEILRSLGLKKSDLLENLPSRDDVLRALGSGIGTRRRSSDVLPGLALFGAGILVGAGLALLFAPQSGQELREEVSERVDEFRERVGGEKSPSLNAELPRS